LLEAKVGARRERIWSSLIWSIKALDILPAAQRTASCFNKVFNVSFGRASIRQKRGQPREGIFAVITDVDVPITASNFCNRRGSITFLPRDAELRDMRTRSAQGCGHDEVISIDANPYMQIPLTHPEVITPCLRNVQAFDQPLFRFFVPLFPITVGHG
jgi:hypothetical protein